MTKTKISIFLSFILFFSFIFQVLPTEAVAIQAYKGYRAELSSTSFSGTIQAQMGKAMTLEAKFKNTGTKTWKNNDKAFITLDVSEPYLRQSQFQHKWWRTNDCPAWLLEKSVKPGEIGTFRFAIQLPNTAGEYTENFRLAATNTAWIPGGNLVINFNVIDPSKPVVISAEPTDPEVTIGAEEIVEPVFGKLTKEITDPRFNPTRYIAKTLDEFTKISLPLKLSATQPEKGAIVRVGLFSTEKEVVVKSTGAFEVRNEKGELLFESLDGKAITTKFDFKTLYSNIYNAENELVFSTDTPIRFVPVDENIPLEITSNKTNTENWKNYTLFKGVIELRYTSDETFWIINELSMEDYLKGSGECGNPNPAGYLQAMAIAERTYATYYLLNPSKHVARGFDLVAHAGDQVYFGYSRELMQPNVAQAVDATNGLIITYNNAVVITPYFARSDGMTRSWKQAWGGTDKAWLQPKYVPFDDGETMLGHGIGMSAWGAWDMAKTGYNFEEIVNYFYTGINLLKYN
ncbi:MAG: SpoIID/LytB domain-containing protein [Patescibacteria group bacterium]